ncbi:MAG: peptidylprolyl isomerase [Planctomycetota bacterium]
MQYPFAPLVVALSLGSAAVAPAAQANLLNADNVAVGTAVIFETDFGDFTVGLFDSVTPLTVDNFLNYVEGTTANGGAYNPGLFHRLIPGSVLQSGFSNLDVNTISVIPLDAPVANEPFVSNTLGTIAMAKTDGDPNSATSQFFFNLGDNSTQFDNQNGGITVFGRVTSGLDVLLNGAAGLTPGDLAGLFGPEYTDLPLKVFADGPLPSNLVSYTVTVQPILGDIDDDGDIDVADLDLLFENFGSGTTPAEGDIDSDGDVDDDDVTAWLNLVGTVAGDANLDQKVDTSDLAILAGNFAKLTSSWAQADFNNDGIANTADLAVLAGTFGTDLTASATATAPVPEPASLALLGLAAPLLLRRQST